MMLIRFMTINNNVGQSPIYFAGGTAEEKVDNRISAPNG
jgi:hypothetical protein